MEQQTLRSDITKLMMNVSDETLKKVTDTTCPHTTKEGQNFKQYKQACDIKMILKSMV